MARTMRLLAVAAFALCLPACVGTRGGKASLDRTSLPAHVLLDLSHPWHSYPAQAVGMTAAGVVAVVTLPLSLGEWAISGRFPLTRGDLGVVLQGAGYVGKGVGFVVGLPFFVLGLPFEQPDTNPAAEPERPSDPPRDDGRTPRSDGDAAVQPGA